VGARTLIACEIVGFDSSGVRCDGCNTVPIVGARHKSQVLPDYDLCSSCHSDELQAAASGPFKRIKIQGEPRRFVPLLQCECVARAESATKALKWRLGFCSRTALRFTGDGSCSKSPPTLPPSQPFPPNLPPCAGVARKLSISDQMHTTQKFRR